jgi:hypothetical protein
MSIVFEYLDEHKEVLLRDNSGRNESWSEMNTRENSLSGSEIGFLNHRILKEVNT